jgi:hypothetical protein
MDIEFINNTAIVSDDTVAFTFEVTNNPREFESQRGKTESLSWSNRHHVVGKWRIYPYGDQNDLPTVIKETIQNNHLAPGALTKQVNMLWGKGPKLYKEVCEGGELVYEWMEDKEIQAWLDSWEWEDYILKCCVDFNYMKGVFTKFYRSLGGRIGRNRIAKLEHVQMDRARLASEYASEERNPTHVVITDHAYKEVQTVLQSKAYHLFNPTNPFQHKNAIYYSNLYSFCTEYYTVPEIYGSLEWIRRSTAVPIIFKALSKNSINVKYHFQSPELFWEDAKETLEKRCTKQGIDYKDSMLEAYKKKFLKKITQVLSSDENVGKLLHTTKKFTVDGTNLIEHGWSIKPIDQNVKDFIQAQIKVSERADHVLTGSTGLHSSIANVGQQGKSDSGSEQYHALNNYLATSVDIPEMIVLKPINYAIKANFPNKNLKLGFYHLGTKKMEDTTPGERNPKL